MTEADHFEIAFNRTMQHEGGYVNDRDDPGGETYMGISRRAHHDWPGWEFIDKHGPGANIPGLDDLVKAFYRRLYWDKLHLSDTPCLELTNAVFDCAVNCGARTAGRWLQYSLNHLNRDGNTWDDITVDGLVGFHTHKALKRCLETTPVKLLIKVFNIYRGWHYVKIMENNSKLEKYARGWLNRI